MKERGGVAGDASAGFVPKGDTVSRLANVLQTRHTMGRGIGFLCVAGPSGLRNRDGDLLKHAVDSMYVDQWYEEESDEDDEADDYEWGGLYVHGQQH